ncbi:TPA: FeS-binding protein [Candidatus Poribacteria bacterium]|nr:FeS-binding protein [Candidatus Poribacteria bacterium]
MAVLKARLTFPNELITEPVIYNLGRKYKIITNIRRANITQNAGWVILEISGDQDEIDKAVEYLEGIKVKVEPVEGDIIQ